MILTEKQVKVPGKRYTLSIDCISTRRLTTIEWLILTCISKFNNSKNMLDNTLKDVFENVFQIQDSELLIKPGIEELKHLRVVEVESEAPFQYDVTPFKDLSLTELGEEMLRDGLLPGEPTEIPITVFYNPLTGKLHPYLVPQNDSSDAAEFGKSTNYTNDFPKDQIIEELQSGRIGAGRFVASKYRIRSIEEIEAKDIDTYVTLTADVNDKGIITTNPEIIAESLKDRLDQLFLSKEIDRKITDALASVSKSSITSIIGSGSQIKTSVLDVCKNGRILFMDAEIYSRHKRNTSAFKGKMLVLFNAASFSVENEKDVTLINIPEQFDIEGCAVINDKNEHVSICRASYEYAGRVLDVPVAFTDKRLSKKNDIAVQWLENVIRNNSKMDVAYLCLYSLPLMDCSEKTRNGLLAERWGYGSFQSVLSDLSRIASMCETMQIPMFDLNSLFEVIISKIDLRDREVAATSIGDLIKSGCIAEGSAIHIGLVQKVVESAEPPRTYLELNNFIMAVGITCHDIALSFDQIIEPLYSNEIITDIIRTIISDTYTKVQELFQLDVFFNDYVDSIRKIELLVANLKLFTKSDETKLQLSIINCPDIASLQSYIAELGSKNAALIERGINIYDVMLQHDTQKSTAYYDNIRAIERFAAEKVEGVISQIQASEVSVEEGEELQKSKVYVLDTCAIIHCPDIFQYFEANEYVRIPTKVIDELGKIKDNRSYKYGNDQSDTARMLVRDIDTIYLKKFNLTNPVLLMIENADLDLLPPDLSADTNDNHILTVALKYKSWNAHLITDDTQFRLMAKSQNINVISGAEFIETHKQYYTNKHDLAEKYRNSESPAIAVLKSMGRQPESPKEKKSKAELNVIIDNMSIVQLKKHIPSLNDKVINYLRMHGVKTVGGFSRLTVEKLQGFPSEGKDIILRNSALAALNQCDKAIEKIKQRYG